MRHPALLTALLLTLMTLPAIASADARPSAKALRTVRTYPLAGHVFSADLPATWGIASGMANFLTLKPTDPDEAAGHLSVGFAAETISATELKNLKLPKDATPEQIIEARLLRINQYRGTPVVFERSKIDIGAFKMTAALIGVSAYPGADGVEIKKNVRTGIVLMHVSKDRIAYSARIRGLGKTLAMGEKALSDNAVLVKKILASFKVQPEATLTKAERATLPKRIAKPAFRISQRRDLKVDIDTDLILPAGWRVTVLSQRAASPSSERGELVLELRPPVAEGQEEGPERVLLIVEGMRVGPLSPNHFLATTTPRLNALGLGEMKRTATSTMHYKPYAHLARASTRYIKATGTTHVHTYNAVDPYDRELTVKSFTAGGFTMAAHVILVGERTRFAALEAQWTRIASTFEVWSDFFLP